MSLPLSDLSTLALGGVGFEVFAVACLSPDFIDWLFAQEGGTPRILFFDCSADDLCKLFRGRERDIPVCRDGFIKITGSGYSVVHGSPDHHTVGWLLQQLAATAAKKVPTADCTEAWRFKIGFHACFEPWFARWLSGESLASCVTIATVPTDKPAAKPNTPRTIDPALSSPPTPTAPSRESLEHAPAAHASYASDTTLRVLAPDLRPAPLFPSPDTRGSVQPGSANPPPTPPSASSQHSPPRASLSSDARHGNRTSPSLDLAPTFLSSPGIAHAAKSCISHAPPTPPESPRERAHAPPPSHAPAGPRHRVFGRFTRVRHEWLAALFSCRSVDEAHEVELGHGWVAKGLVREQVCGTGRRAISEETGAARVSLEGRQGKRRIYFMALKI